MEEAVRRSSAVLPVTSEVGQLRSGVVLRRRPFSRSSNPRSPRPAGSCIKSLSEEKKEGKKKERPSIKWPFWTLDCQPHRLYAMTSKCDVIILRE